MAIFGDLEHHTLTDLFRVLSVQVGTLFFHQAYQGRTVELVLEHGQLHALYVDGFPVPGAAQAQAVVHHLHAQGHGAFEFQPRPATLGAGSRQGARLYTLPLLELLQDALAKAIPADQLPHPQTRFVVQPSGVQVPVSLTLGWQLLAPHLQAGGASASELARLTGQPEADVQATLYRLRAVDLVAPLRSVAPTAPAPAGRPEWTTPLPAAAPGAAPAPLLRRLLGALRRLTGSGAA
ncbi:hypothetical protein [Deinococcus petrolearius]|uniref:DUF4388 domain-containing protein n=1 Tax=Deinococcus petrolearius TaxID=1751295 RepID=A0ABW1DJA1_9DEIO